MVVFLAVPAKNTLTYTFSSISEMARPGALPAWLVRMGNLDIVGATDKNARDQPTVSD
jgi:hypothetical protein